MLLLITLVLITACACVLSSDKTIATTELPIQTITTKHLETTPPPEIIEIKSLYFFISFQRYFGIQIVLRPLNQKGLLVDAEGTISATLWSQSSLTNEKKVNILQIWDDITITKKDYTKFLGARVYFPYSNYQPNRGEYATLVVTLTTISGKSITHELAGIEPGKEYSC
jgi:hypothetical protein